MSNCKKKPLRVLKLLNLSFLIFFIMRCDETGPYFESIELNKQFTVLGAGQTEQLYAKMNLTRRGRDDIAECRVDWYSNDTSIVTVSKDGLLTGVSKGTTVITALSSRDEKMDQCTVTVIDRSIPVTSIRLKSSTVIDPGKSEKLVPQFLPSDASNQNIIWESSDSTIAAVEQSGTVTAKSDGASVITVTTIDGNKTAQCSVYVYIQVEQIRLYHNPIIEIDQTMKIVPDISPTDAFNKEVTWSTSNESVVSVSPDGVITAKAIGNAVISVVSLDGLKSDQCNVTVVNKNSVTVTDIDGNIYSTVRIGNQLWTVENLKTKTLNDGTPLLYFSKDNYESPNYCIYNENNNLFNKFGALYNKSAVASGKLAPKGWRIPDHDDFEKMAVYLMKNGLTSFDRAINNAGINNNYNYIAKPLAAKTDWETRLSPPPWDPEGVGNPVEGFCPGNDLNKNNLTGFTALPGGYGNPTGGFENINIRASFWSITQRNSRDAFGIFEINFSSPHISLPHNDDYEYDPGNKCYSVRIMRDIDIDEINISAVTLDPVSLTLAKNNSSQLFHEIIPFDATNQKVVWSSSDSTVVFVANGVVVAKETGSASVTVTTLDGNLTASCMVTVPEETISVKKVILDNTSLSLIPEQTDTLNAIVLPEDATDSKIHWNSSDTNVVKVKNGVITAKTYGKATITVTTNDGEKTAKCVVTVPEIIIPVATVVLDKSTLTLSPDQTDTLNATVVPEDATDSKIHWNSSDTNVVKVKNGVITAKTYGKATITVTTNDGEKTAKCVVTVPEIIIPVATVVLDKSTLTLSPDQTDTLNATVVPEDATDSKIHWNSSDTNVVKVKNGVITAKTYGKATITVTTNDGEKTAKCVVTVPEIIIPVATVVLDKSTLTLSPDQTDTLNATVVPEDATDSKIHWNSSDTNVVKIKNGVITAKATGTAQITVTTNDKGKTAKCNVIVQKTIVHVAGVILSNSSLSLLPDQTDTLKAIVIPEDATDKDVTWSSSDTNIITVIDGVITAKAIGSATITVTTNDGNKVADCNIHVSENMVSVTGVILSNTSVILQPNQTDTLSVKILPENASNKKVTWSSSDTSIVSVVFGVITAKNIGNATVTVTTQDGNKTAGFEVSVIAPTVSVYSVTLDKIALVINPDSTDTIKATILPQDATNKTLSWSSSDINIVSVADGVITAHDTGTAKITVTTHDGNKTAACLVMVNLPTISVSSVTLNKTRVTLMQDQIEILRVTILPENATNKTVAWKSTDSSVVSVEDGGIVAINPGTAQIIVTSIDSRQTATCTVTVTEPFTPVEGITVDQSEVNVSVYTTHQLHETVLPENANNKNVTWTSSDTLIVKVKNGLITAIKTGTAVITVTSEDGGYSALCDVLVQEEEYGSVRDIEGNEYSTVRIGNLIWTIENLRTTKYNDNEEIPDFTGDSEAWKTDSAGALSIDSDGSVYYNWYAASNGRLAPTEGGWRIPTNDDWIGLIKTLVKCGHNFEQVTDTIYHNTLGSSIAAKSGWATNDIPGSPGHNLSENNSSRFNALPTGRCHLLGSIWENDGTSAYWWSSTSSADVIDGITTYMLSESKHLNVGATNKRHGQSIRLVKDVELY